MKKSEVVEEEINLTPEDIFHIVFGDKSKPLFRGVYGGEDIFVEHVLYFECPNLCGKEKEVAMLVEEFLNKPKEEDPTLVVNKHGNNATEKRNLRFFIRKLVKRTLLFFGYDLINEYQKKAFKIFGFIVYENLCYGGVNRIYILSLPILEIRKRGKHHVVHLAIVSQTIENLKKLRRFFKIRRDFKQANRYYKKKNLAIYPKLRAKIANGEKITICLFVSRISCWIYTDLYKQLEKSRLFKVVVVVKPFMYNGHDAMVNYMETTYVALKQRGYNVIKGYDDETHKFLNVKKKIKPDIVFYTKYWRPQFHKNFYIKKFRDKLSFYTSYCYDIAYHPEVMNFKLNNLVDRYFMPTQIHKKMAEVTMANHAQNVHVVGAPKLDIFFDKSYKPRDVWKPQNGKRKKRIIWAPHHSDNFPGDMYQFNAFYEIADFMFEMAEKYKDDIQIAFKPHPMLFPYLRSKKWGLEITENYYDSWANLENGQLETGDFIDLFLTSDAMILDSISFIAEYTATNKPSLFTIGPTSRVKLNDFGNSNFEVLYHTRGDHLKEDIERFIVDVVINGKDSKKEERTEFVNKHLLPPNGKTSADNILDNIIDEINNGDKK